MIQKTENQDITSKQQDFSPEDLLFGQVVVDEITVEQMKKTQKFLEDKYSHLIDEIVKDFDDDPNEDNSFIRTYLTRRSPLAFSMVVARRQMRFRINFDDTNHYGYDKTSITKYNQVVIHFEDGETTRSAYGTKSFDISRPRKIKHISKLIPTIDEILNRLVKIAESERKSFLETKLENKKYDAGEKLRDLEDELQNVKDFQEKYEDFITDGTVGLFSAITGDLSNKIETEKTRLKEEGLL